ncbi:hypothetical protein ACHAPJ_007081 [Fusarium lateritium]
MSLSCESFGQITTIYLYQELATRAHLLREATAISEPDIRHFTVLMAACKHQDIFYLAIHQLSCLWSMDKATIYETFDSLATMNDIDSALGAIQKILNNDGLCPYNLQWFANFPRPMREGAHGFQDRSLMARLASFIKHFSTLWRPLLDQAEAENRPIAGSVMRVSMKCPSPILRYILFVASLLHIGIEEVPDAASLDDDFEKEDSNQCSKYGESVREVLASEHAKFRHDRLRNSTRQGKYTITSSSSES